MAPTNIDGRFLEIVPPEVGDVLDWYAAEHARQTPPAAELSEFAGKFLVAMLDDGAVFPVSSAVSPAQTLALVLVHHQGNGEDPGAWLNLGIALRRMALYRTQDSESVNRLRLRLALEAFDISLHLQADNIGKNIRAWTGKAFTYHQLGSYHEEVSCCLRALDSDSSDPKLWLFYGFALKAAGRESEAVSVMDNAYEAYLAAGEPEDLRDVFAGVHMTLPRC